MFKVVNWAVWWDVDQRNGWVDLYFQGAQQPFRVGPLPAPEFTAMTAVLTSAKSVGRDIVWDSQKKILAA